MAGDEPTLGEVMRRLDEISRILRDFSHDYARRNEVELELRQVHSRLDDHDNEIRDLWKAQKEAAERLRMSGWRIVTAFIAPIVVAVIVAVMTIALSGGFGHG